MGALVEYAEDLAEDIGAALVTASNKAKATANIRQLNPPCVLVSPVPRRELDTITGGFEATWSIYCIAPGPGDLTDARILEDLVDVVVSVVPVFAVVEPVLYAIPNASDPKPAQLITFTNHVNPEV